MQHILEAENNFWLLFLVVVTKCLFLYIRYNQYNYFYVSRLEGRLTIILVMDDEPGLNLVLRID
jgi:hypothetical protein